MASNAEVVTIAQALLALSDAVAETRRALLTLEPRENKEFNQHLEAANTATNQYLEHMQKLIDLITDSRD